MPALPKKSPALAFMAVVALALAPGALHAQTDHLIEFNTGRTSGTFTKTPVVMRAILSRPGKPTDIAVLFFRGIPGYARIETVADKGRNLIPFMRAGIRLFLQGGVAQAQHGSAPDIAGRDIANPVSLIGSMALLLRWLGEWRSSPELLKAADAVEAAIEAALEDPKTRTRDLGGALGTKAFGAAVCTKLRV